MSYNFKYYQLETIMNVSIILHKARFIKTILERTMFYALVGPVPQPQGL